MRARIFLWPGRLDGSSDHNRSAVSAIAAALIATLSLKLSTDRMRRFGRMHPMWMPY